MLSKEQLEEEIKLGLTDKQIAEKYNIPKFRTVKNLRKKYGIGKKQEKIPKAELAEDIKNLSIDEIAKKHSRTLKRIKELLRGYEIEYDIKNKPVSFSVSDIEKIKELVEAGKSDEEIALSFNLPKTKWTSIRHVRLKKLNIKKRVPNNTADKEKIRKGFESKKSDQELAGELGVKEGTIASARQKLGLFVERDIHKVTKTVLEKYYVEWGWTDQEIADFLGIEHNRVWEARKKYNINRTMKWQKLNLPIDFTKEQKDLVYGSLLGDSSISKVAASSYELFCAHANKQKNYTRLKAIILDKFARNFKHRKHDDMYEVRSYSHPLIKELYDIYYPNSTGNKRTVFPDEILDEFTLEMLVYWYFDDGWIEKSNEVKRTPVIGSAFDFNNQKLLIETLWKKYKLKIGFEPTKQTLKTQKYFSKIRLYVNSDLLDIIKNLAPECLEYKIPDEIHPQAELSGDFDHIDDQTGYEKRTCPKCGNKFVIEWYKAQRFCSRTCQSRFNYQLSQESL